jgi:hypothetical protein
MKKAMILFCLTLAATFAYAQHGATKSNYPYQTISKDVQRIQYRNVQFQPATIKIGDVAQFSTKGISRVQRKQTTPSIEVKMNGMPSHVISKGVARMQYERNGNK